VGGRQRTSIFFDVESKKESSSRKGREKGKGKARKKR